MKIWLLPFAATAASFAVHGQFQVQGQSPHPATPASDLRTLVRQIQAGNATLASVPPRQLTEQERAELRRQVLEQSRKMAGR